jgi:uncharacterized protein YdeI (BOF family)
MIPEHAVARHDAGRGGVSAPRGVLWSSRAGVLLAALAIAATALSGCAFPEEPMMEFTPAPESGEQAPSASGLIDSGSELPAQGALPEGATATVRSAFTVYSNGEKIGLSGYVTELSGGQGFTLDDGTGAIHVECDFPIDGMRVGDELLVTGIVNVEESPFRVKILADEVERP